MIVQYIMDTVYPLVVPGLSKMSGLLPTKINSYMYRYLKILASYSALHVHMNDLTGIMYLHKSGKASTHSSLSPFDPLRSKFSRTPFPNGVCAWVENVSSKWFPISWQYLWVDEDMTWHVPLALMLSSCSVLLSAECIVPEGVCKHCCSELHITVEGVSSFVVAWLSLHMQQN